MAVSGPRVSGSLPVALGALDLATLRPARPLSLPVPLASGRLLTVPLIVTGASLRETQGLSSNSATAAAAAMAPAIAAQAGSIAVCTAFQVTGAGATAGSVIVVTLTGLAGGTKSYDIVVPAGVGVSITPLLVVFSNPLQASAANTPITLNVPSFGVGNTNAAATIDGGYLAQVDLIDGGDVNGQLLSSLQLPPNGVFAGSLAGGSAWCDNGIFFSLVSGQVKGTIWAQY